MSAPRFGPSRPLTAVRRARIGPRSPGPREQALPPSAWHERQRQYDREPSPQNRLCLPLVSLRQIAFGRESKHPDEWQSARSRRGWRLHCLRPAGYNPRGWYGIPWTITPSAGATLRTDPAAATDPPNLSELAEKDVMNLLAMARQEFNVDDRRTYLMGHSMGGAGTLIRAQNMRRIGRRRRHRARGMVCCRTCCRI